MRNSGLGKKILILVCILAVPGFLYYLLTVGGKNRYKSLQFFGPKELSGTYHKFHGEQIPDTLYHKLPPFTLYNQNGQAISLQSFDKKIFVASFFYTRCPDICNKINDNVERLAQHYVNNKMLRFVSVTVDPERDNVSVLKEYAAKYKLPADKWMFLTGDTATVQRLAARGFLLNAVKVNDEQFVFSDKLVLIDAEKRIRGYYSGTDVNDINRLNDEIKVLITEELRKIKAPN